MSYPRHRCALWTFSIAILLSMVAVDTTEAQLFRRRFCRRRARRPAPTCVTLQRGGCGDQYDACRVASLGAVYDPNNLCVAEYYDIQHCDGSGNSVEMDDCGRKCEEYGCNNPPEGPCDHCFNYTTKSGLWVVGKDGMGNDVKYHIDPSLTQDKKLGDLSFKLGDVAPIYVKFVNPYVANQQCYADVRLVSLKDGDFTRSVAIAIEVTDPGPVDFTDTKAASIAGTGNRGVLLHYSPNPQLPPEYQFPVLLLKRP